MNEDRELDLFQAVGKIAERLERMDHDLFGNGQKGKIAILEERLDSLESTRDSQKGMTSLTKWLVGIITTTEIWHLFSSYHK